MRPLPKNRLAAALHCQVSGLSSKPLTFIISKVFLPLSVYDTRPHRLIQVELGRALPLDASYHMIESGNCAATLLSRPQSKCGL